MLRSLHMKLVLILVLLILSVMVVVGTLLDNRVSSYFLDDFRLQMEDVFTQRFLSELNQACSQENASDRLYEMIDAYSGLLGIDSNRDFCILSSDSGVYLTGSDDTLGAELEITPNIITALDGEVGARLSSVNDYMDFAVPVSDGENGFIIYIYDNKNDTSELTWMLFSIVIQVVLFGLLFAVLLSFLLSKTMTNPIENITKGAAKLATGDFDDYIEVHSDDEIGVLTQTFNYMARTIRDTVQSVEDERNKLNTLFLHMTDGVASFNSDGTVLSMNPAAEQMLGAKYKEGLTFSELLPGIERPARTEEIPAVDFSSAGKAFQIFFASLSTPDDPEGLMAVIHDVTEQYRLEQVRREFIANVSHELRTPLTSIKSYTETILDAPDLPEELHTKFLGVINNEADRMVRIVKDLLTLSRLDYGRLEINYSRFPVDKLMGGIYDAMLFEARNHEHELLLELDDPLPVIEGDRERIEQVVVNIVSNSIKYTPNGGTIVMSASNIEGGVKIVVQDNGIGIPKEDLPRLFERFYRVDKARARATGGTGLGLAIASEIVRLHGGRIDVESEFGKGTRMIVTLPVTPGRETKAQNVVQSNA